MANRRKALVPTNRCVACGQCAKECPKQAISIYKGMYAVVSETCVGCGKCAKACPAGIIEFVESFSGTQADRFAGQDVTSAAQNAAGGAQR